MNPYRKMKEANPAPDEEIDSHDKLWQAVRHLRIRQAVMDERLRWNVWSLTVVITLLGVILGKLLVL